MTPSDDEARREADEYQKRVDDLLKNPATTAYDIMRLAFEPYPIPEDSRPASTHAKRMKALLEDPNTTAYDIMRFDTKASRLRLPDEIPATSPLFPPNRGDSEEERARQRRTKRQEPGTAGLRRAKDALFGRAEGSVPHLDRNDTQAKQSLCIFRYGTSLEPEKRKLCQQAVVTDENKHELQAKYEGYDKRVRRSVYKRLRPGLRALVGETGGVAVWEETDRSERMAFLAKVFDRDATTICEWVFANEARSVDFKGIFSANTPDRIPWQRFAKYRFCRLSEMMIMNDIVWELDCRLIFYEIYRSMAVDHDLEDLIPGGLGSLDDVPCTYVPLQFAKQEPRRRGLRGGLPDSFMEDSTDDEEDSDEGEDEGEGEDDMETDGS